MTTANSERGRSRSVARAAAVLQLLAEMPREAMGPSEISRRLGIPKATVLTICTALVDAQLLRHSKKGYMLGLRLAELGKAYLSSVEEVEEFYVVCRERLGSVPQTVQLAVLGDGLTVVYLARFDGHEPLHLGLTSEIGRLVPAQCTAAGKALLAALEPEKLEARLATASLRGLTANSIVSVPALEKELATVRERGYASEYEEVVLGLRCFGVHLPTFQREDGLIGVSFTFRTASFNETDEPLAVAELQRFARELGTRIGSASLAR